MPKIARELSAIDIKRLIRPGRHAVGYISGLLIVVKDSGAKSWMLRTVIGNRRCSIGLGPYPEISLAEARNKARRYKEDIRQGYCDPLEQKKAIQRSLIKLQNGCMTFAKAAQFCHEKKISEFRNDKHGRDWINSINRYAAPIIGNLPVDEIDLESRTWTIPAERMKTGKEHKVPLVGDAMKLLNALPRFQDSNYIFTAARGGPLSDMSISAVCRRMNVEAVPHGFRSTFRDWCAENTNFPREVAEMALAHTVGNAVELAYRRGDLFTKRRKLMDAWASYCNQVQTGATITPIRRVI